MSPRKSPEEASSRPKKALLPRLVPKMKDFLNALGERYQRILQIIDDALDSDSMKERTWAVDLILKRLPLPEKPETSAKKAKTAKPTPLSAPPEVKQMSTEELMARIRESLKPPSEDVLADPASVEEEASDA